MNALNVIIKPVVTEKATDLSTKLAYSFWIRRDATKIDVKQAVKAAYGADVDSVRIINTPVKKRAMKKSIVNKRPNMKKAIVTIKGGKKLDINKVNKESKESKK